MSNQTTPVAAATNIPKAGAIAGSTAELLAEWHGLPVAVQAKDAPPQIATPEEGWHPSLIQIEHAGAEACRLAAEARQLLEWIQQDRAGGRVVSAALSRRYSLSSLKAEQAASFYKSLIEHHAGVAHSLMGAA